MSKSLPRMDGCLQKPAAENYRRCGLFRSAGYFPLTLRRSRTMTQRPWPEVRARYGRDHLTSRPYSRAFPFRHHNIHAWVWEWRRAPSESCWYLRSWNLLPVRRNRRIAAAVVSTSIIRQLRDGSLIRINLRPLFRHRCRVSRYNHSAGHLFSSQRACCKP